MKLKCTIAFIASFLVISTVSAFELVSSEEVRKSEEAAMLEMELTVPDALAPPQQHGLLTVPPDPPPPDPPDPAG